MTTIRANGVDIADPSSVPQDRLFRDAWTQGDEGAITLDAGLMKPIARDRVNAWRDAADQAPVIAANGNIFSADEISHSQRNIIGGSVMAIVMKGANGDYEVRWTDSDNNPVTLDGDGMLSLGTTLATRTSFLYNKASDIKNDIEATSDAGYILDIMQLLAPGVIVVPFTPE